MSHRIFLTWIKPPGIGVCVPNSNRRQASANKWRITEHQDGYAESRQTTESDVYVRKEIDASETARNPGHKCQFPLPQKKIAKCDQSTDSSLAMQMSRTKKMDCGIPFMYRDCFSVYTSGCFDTSGAVPGRCLCNRDHSVHELIQNLRSLLQVLCSK